jgi:lauroyl/myristoyl acyltransferase
VIGQGFGLLLQIELSRGVVALAQPSRVWGITELARWYRAKRGIATVLTGSRDVLLTLQGVGASGRSVGLLVDQKPRSGGVFIRFLEGAAAFPHKGLGVMVQQGTPALCAAAVRVFPGYFRYIYSDLSNEHLQDVTVSHLLPRNEIVHAPSGVHPVTIKILAEFAAWLETEIRKSPTQWSWDYKKWSRKVPSAK